MTFAELGIEVPMGRSGEIDTTCPKCSPTRKKSRAKCLSVNTLEGTYFCHHCGWSGRVGEDANGYGAPLRAAERVYTRPDAPRESTLPESVVAWFAHRGIPEWVLAEAHITAGDEFCPQLGEKVTAIRFPYTREGALVNIKHRAHPKHFWMVAGAERILYGLDDIAGAEEIVVVEGEMDKLSVDAVHGPACVSVPDGAPPVGSKQLAAKFTFLDGVAEERFAAAKRILLATDMDAPGRALADELARRFGYAKCARVDWPEGCKDANETLMRYGQHAVCEALAQAQPYPVEGIITVRELAGALDDLYDNGLDRGVMAGWTTFDRHYRARPGLLTIVTGAPGSGKSFFLDNLFVRLAMRHGWTIGVCSPENQPLQRHLAGLLAVYTGEPFGDGPQPRMSKTLMHQARDWAAQHFAFVLPEEPKLETILARADVLVYRMGMRGLVIDPWNELDHSRPSAMSETEFTSQSLSTLRNWARRAGVAVWLVAHPTKLTKDPESKQYPVPTPYDISGSAHFYNKADACFAVWRDPQTDMPEVHVQKVRFQETGEIGVTRFQFERPTGRFTEVGAK